jgi:hypothetical protein
MPRHSAHPQSGAHRVMQPVEYFTWLLPNDGSATPRPSQFKMTREQASAYPGAVCVEGTREIRMQPHAANDDPPRTRPKVIAPLPKDLQTKPPR